MQFTSFALPPHPLAFAWIPQAFSVKNIEALVSIFGIECSYSVSGYIQQRGIVRHDFLISIRPIGQQREAHRSIRVGQITHLKLLGLLLDPGLVDEHRRHDDECAQCLRHAVFKIDPWQVLWRKIRTDEMVYQADSYIRCREQSEQYKQD